MLECVTCSNVIFQRISDVMFTFHFVISVPLKMRVSINVSVRPEFRVCDHHEVAHHWLKMQRLKILNVVQQGGTFFFLLRFFHSLFLCSCQTNSCFNPSCVHSKRHHHLCVPQATARSWLGPATYLVHLCQCF